MALIGDLVGKRSAFAVIVLGALPSTTESKRLAAVSLETNHAATDVDYDTSAVYEPTPQAQNRTLASMSFLDKNKCSMITC